MNVSELARKLRISSKELLEILPMVGFDIGKRAIKIDNRQAQQIIEQWSSLRAKYRELTAPKEVPLAQTQAMSGAPKEVKIGGKIVIKDFAQKLQVPASKILTALMKNGVLLSMNESIDFDTASVVGQDLGYEIIADSTAQTEAEEKTSQTLEALLATGDEKNLIERPPVVVVMGHVDHGKTKLLDAIRQTNIIAGESGGITQHIGAYQAKKKDKLITFIDTPGHEAFTTMRSRGARVADIAILVVAADDSIQPQTKESIKIIKSAGLPMVVAINKIDKPEANIDRVKQDLAALDLIPEDWGGKTVCVPISAKNATGIDELLDMVLLVAEAEKGSLKADPKRQAVGTIIESHIDRGEGPVATLLIQNGTLRRGDLLIVGDSFYGKIRAMKNFMGEDVETAPPSMPVKIIGLKAAPSVGDILQVTDEADKHQKISKYKLVAQSTDYTPMRETAPEGSPEIQSVNIILKADVLGSLEAILASLATIEHPEIVISVVAKGLGNITEGDIDRAIASQALVIGFHVKPTTAAEAMAKDKGITISLYEVIYKLLDDVKERVESLLKPEVIRTDLGALKVLATFLKEKDTIIAGGIVTKGAIVAGTKADVVRDGVVKTSGTIIQVQANKVDVNEVTQGMECGLKFKGKPIIEKDDILEIYREESKEKKLS